MYAGTGLVTAYVPDCGYHSLQASLPEAMVITDKDDRVISDINFNINPNAIGIGIGLGTDKRTVQALELFLIEND